MSIRKVTGHVVSNHNAKTIVVEVVMRRRHPVYAKQYMVSRKYHAHDPEGLAGLGDRVRIVESRPVSKRKNWQLAKVIEKAKTEGLS